MLKEASVPAWLGNFPHALRSTSRALKILTGIEGDDAAAERARLYALYGSIRVEQGRSLEGIRWCRLAVEEAEAAGARDALGHAYFLLDWAYVALGRYDEAVYSPLALAIYEELGNLHRQGLVLNNMGVFAHYQGRWDEALELYKRGGEAWAQAGDRWNGAGLATMNVGEVLADQGHVEEAEALLRDALRVVRASESGSRIAMVAMRLGRLLSRTGRFEEAQALLGEAREEYQRSGPMSDLSTTEAWIAECLILQGDSEAALALATEALDTGRALESSFDAVAMLQRIRGSALLQLGRLEEAEVVLSTALDEARNRKADYEAALALDALAALARSTGKRTQKLTRERDAILRRLGVVRIPEIPLPKLAAEPV